MSTAAQMPSNAGPAPDHSRIAIIGTGFAGLGMAIQLQKAGEQDFRLFEKAGGVGGTWRVNHYPGCACDVQSHLYSFSFEPNPEWTRLFAPQQEIRRYLESCADKYRLYPHIHLNTALVSARWGESDQYWHLTDEHGSAYTADILVAGIGGLSRASYPDLPGIERFRGKTFHSQDWDHDYDLAGKRVAVIGTGASAIQFVPQVQKQAARLTLFQRSAPWVMPKPDRAITEKERRWFRRLPLAQKLRRKALYWMLESRVIPILISPKMLKLVKKMALGHIHRQIKDPQLRAQVTPDYEIGCKRILLSNNYYPALGQPNVEVVSEGIREVTATGIITNDGIHREMDALIYGTGFKASDPVPAGLLTGRNGQDLQALWRNGPEAYKGTTVAGFPNFFMVGGPNTGLGHNSMIYMIESQIQYVLDTVTTMQREGIQSVEVEAGQQQAYNQRLQRSLSGSVWLKGGCTSWYLHPETGKNVALWPGFTFRFRNQTRHFDRHAYRLKNKTLNTAAQP